MKMSFLGRFSVVVMTTGLLFLVARSAEADGDDTCMSRWLILSDISNSSVPSYEASLKSLMFDESSYAHSLKKHLIPFVLHRHPKDSTQFLQCIEKRSVKCRRRAPCGVGGKCLLNPTAGYYCKCRTGYTGPFCQEDINECLSNPCKNDGTCFNEVNAFMCRCPIQYKGKTCEKRVFRNITKEDIFGEITELKAKSTVVENQLSRIMERLDLVLARPVFENSENYPAASCMAINQERRGRAFDGFFWIRPTSYNGSSYKAYCDMTTQGGGWTLFATKVSPGFKFSATKFNPASANSTTSDARGCIFPGKNWSEVLFRFGPRPSPHYVIYSRRGGRASSGKTYFNRFLECSPSVQRHHSVDGFAKYTSSVNGRIPRTGYHGFEGFFFHINFGITFNCNENNQQYIDLHSYTCRRNSIYNYIDDSRARDTKCVAGYCYLNRPVWLMYR